MENAFKSFKDRYVGGFDTESSISGAFSLSKKIETIYENAYANIALAMVKSKKDVSYATFAKQTALLSQLGEILSTLKHDLGSTYEEATYKVSDYASEVAVKDLELLGKGITHPEEWHKKFNEAYVKKTVADNYSHIAGQTTKMLSIIKQILRQESAAVFRRAAAEGVSRKKAAKLLQAELMMKDPDFKFTDRIGRKWDTKTYFEMMSKTVMANTLNECYVNSLTSEGQDLVKVSIQGAKDACRKWEGKVLSLTGTTKGYPTLSSVMSTKEIFHPRCKHTLVAYHQEIDEIFESIKAGKKDKARENAV